MLFSKLIWCYWSSHRTLYNINRFSLSVSEGILHKLILFYQSLSNFTLDISAFLSSLGSYHWSEVVSEYLVHSVKKWSSVSMTCRSQACLLLVAMFVCVHLLRRPGGVYALVDIFFQHFISCSVEIQGSFIAAFYCQIIIDEFFGEFFTKDEVVFV